MIRRFNRYEMKYLIPIWKCEQIMNELPEHAAPDSHGGRSGYPIVSLYYDSDDFSCFWAKVDGIRFRRKLRLRIYPKTKIEDTDLAMVEIKQRSNRTVQKRRLELPLAIAEKLCAGTLEPADFAQIDALDQEVASEVVYLVNALHLRPAAITAYHRIAFVGNEYEPGLRITFDLNVRGRTHALKVNRDAENHRITGDDWCVMEVKSDDKVPGWVTSMLARHGCQMQRISKYCAVISRLSSTALPSTVVAQTSIDRAELSRFALGSENHDVNVNLQQVSMSNERNR